MPSSTSNRPRAAGRNPSPPPQRHHRPSKTDARKLKRKREDEDLSKLQEAIKELDPRSPSIKNFADLPLCEPTAKGLHASHFKVLTDIQAHAIPLALKGRDILGAAKTGSGKTLAFLVPLLERLYAARWTRYDGLGALVISPTRELAVQIFEVLRKIGRFHDLSAGLVIGGKSLESEAQHLAGMSILVCTPGRMLQHLDQTPGLSYDNLQMLVLDEADRIMDAGFEAAVNALVEHLPRKRQTLLFSATQSKRVSDLARLSLRDPEYLSVHHEAAAATPAGLQQHYVVAPLAEKLDTLWGFIRANLHCKTMVFFSSGKQVRFAYEAFRRMEPGTPLLHLHGRQKQAARLEITANFAATRRACLLATDVVARGVDFPAVDWVIQADAPEDADTYIHRVGRTARYESDGRAVLFLDPAEEAGMLARLAHRRVPIQKVAVKDPKRPSIREELQRLCFQHRDVKYLAQKAFVSYTRSVHLQKDKGVFALDKLDLDGYAASLGLPETPQIRFQKGEDVKRLKNASRTAARLLLDGSDTDTDEEDLTVGGSGEEEKKQKKKEIKAKDEVRTKFQKMSERTNQDVLSSHYLKLMGEEEKGSGGGQQADEDDFFSVKRVLPADGDVDVSAAADVDVENFSKGLEEEEEEDHGTGKHTTTPAGDTTTAQKAQQMPKVVRLGRTAELVIDSKRREKLLGSKKKLLKYKDHGTRIVFDDDGQAHPTYKLQGVDDFARAGPAEEQRRVFVDGEAARVREQDVTDKEVARQKRRDKRDRQRAREREEREREEEREEEREGRGREKGKGNVRLLGGEGDGQGQEDPLALLRSLPVGSNNTFGGEEEEEEERRDGEIGQGERPKKKKKARKWSQREDDDGGEGEGDETSAKKTKRRKEKDGAKKRSSKKVVEIDREPETLEDFETLAVGLLE